MEHHSVVRMVSRKAVAAVGVALVGWASLGCSRPRDRAQHALNMGDGERAVRFFSLALDATPADSVLRRGLAEASLLVARAKAEDGEDKPADWARAGREFERSPHADTSRASLLEEVRFGWARSLLRAGDTLGAMHKLESLLEERPKAVRARNLLAIVVDHRGDGDRAVELFLQNIAIDSSSADAYFNLALVEWGRRRNLVAIDYIGKASKLAPKDPEILWWLQYMLGAGDQE